MVGRLRSNDGDVFLRQHLIGLEKESLRVAIDGTLSQRPHPRALGSALTHPSITTDYSEAMLELITPPMSTAGEALSMLCDIHKFVYDNIGDEILWSTSMPCVLAGETNIPIALYGSSHAGRMKHIYRVGLGHRYGKVMQVISGVHFNYSVDPHFWPLHAEMQGWTGDLQPLINDAYMGMVRNLQRYGWVIPYLFGASPAVCKSFFGDKTVTMLEFDKGTFYEPYATSLRMSDIGYQNQKEESVGIKANYDSLQSYIDSLRCAIETPAPLWEMIGLKEADGAWRQLNTNILQIENEYYSTVRPKQVLQGMEKPVSALQSRGIRYIELRSLDVN
ncbi:MAG: glutamate--cysteine ligase, partial [Sedimenticolaceae bacterium]|nr:glutamate--cysteine ligase [Sedimenticolaceae bacterium]